ncbi:uncharacterized protein LOC109707285 isoform X1 [Ananas comosus]|uniref:Uncharacterized protein LOC109707285 isoform X1 n=1 Tax=Ananas comosus TaxID=4615 RepID=A0A6P5EKF5_ANACO|nr:uncharacterized protein LOC109707285 isoform X1 [Ananas comosus]XP_020084034.1 uncharacterized protein LOC109707285 isoform X1 [Ananas comosus]XP_020084035.1 uncharacterized protein LOC109707285 isoform X1 [Ananas comosus]XP_020084036.1 uncharacterized protein LOC109707285 isoform X1 [Ananas comosus]
MGWSVLGDLRKVKFEKGLFPICLFSADKFRRKFSRGHFSVQFDNRSEDYESIKMTDMINSNSKAAEFAALHKEWDETLCPICMDHPHNAVLLICASHDNGCRSYICDTSYRHSNCLDRFKKLKLNNRNSSSQSSSSLLQNSGDGSLPTLTNNSVDTHEDHNHEANTLFSSLGLSGELEENSSNQITRRSSEVQGEGSICESNFLKCPLCRGEVKGWMIISEARQYLDQKSRACSRESCAFSGNYRELRRHARRVHPTTRPAEVDPSRQRAWRRLEHQREYGDILSAIRSAMPGAIVFGDYIIENGDGGLSVNDRDSSQSGEGSNGPWWTTFFLFHMINNSPIRPLEEARSSSRAWRTHRRSGRHRHLWGENLLGLQDDDDDDDGDEDDEDEDMLIPRRRRRFVRSRSDEEHS